MSSRARRGSTSEPSRSYQTRDAHKQASSKPQKRSAWPTFLGVGFLAFLVIAAFLAFFHGQSASPEVKPAVGYTAPDFTLTGLDGQSYSLSKQKGHGVFLFIWDSTCPACKGEFPQVQQQFEKLGQKIDFWAVDLTFSESSVDDVRKYLSSAGITMPVLLDSQAQVAQAYNIQYTPTMFYIDSKGIIRAVDIGEIAPDVLVSHLNLIAGGQ